MKLSKRDLLYGSRLEPPRGRAQEKRRWRHFGNTGLVVELHCDWLTDIFTQLSHAWNILSLQTRLGILSLYSLAVVGDERWSL